MTELLDSAILGFQLWPHTSCKTCGAIFILTPKIDKKGSPLKSQISDHQSQEIPSPIFSDQVEQFVELLARGIARSILDELEDQSDTDESKAEPKIQQEELV